MDQDLCPYDNTKLEIIQDEDWDEGSMVDASFAHCPTCRRHIGWMDYGTDEEKATMEKIRKAGYGI